MFHSDNILLGERSIPWDSACAHELLQVTHEQTRILGNIPGWSVDEIEKSDKHISESETNPLVVGSPLSQLRIADARIVIAKAGSDIAVASSTDTFNNPNPNSDNITKVSAFNCNLPWKENSTIALSKKKRSFMESISLYANKVVDMFSSIPRKRSNSLSDVHGAKLDDSLPFSKSETSLNGDAYGHQTSKNIKKKTCEKLDTRILNHPFLRALPSTEDEYEDLLHKAMEDSANRRELLKKRLGLLERRFSPSTENGLLWPSEGIVTSEFSLASVTNQNLTYTGVCLPDLVCDNNLINFSNAILDEINSPLIVCPQSSKNMNKLNTIIVENKKLLTNIAKSIEKVSEAELTEGTKSTNNVLSTVHNEESMPLTTIAPSPDKVTNMQKEQISVVVQPTQTEEVVKSNPLIESCVSQDCRMLAEESSVSEPCGIMPVKSCALQPYETPPYLNAPFIQSKLINQVITNSEMHPKNDGYFSKTNVADTENAHSNVFPENGTGHDAVKNSASGKLGGKRKQQDKGSSKPRKKSSPTNSLVRIQYTGDQVRNMVQVMKKFQLEM